MNSWKLTGKSKYKGERVVTMSGVGMHTQSTIELMTKAYVVENKDVPNPSPQSSTSITTSQPSSSSSSSSSSTQPEPKSGVLLIRVCEARGISLPPGVTLPPSHLQPVQPRSNRDSFNRKQNWWLPYVVLEFDKNEILIDALGGDTNNPIYQYRANL